MKAQEAKARSLLEFVDDLQSSGRYSFTREEAGAACGLSDVLLRQAAGRLQARGRLVMPRRGFYVIVPLEYRTAGAPPPAWYVDALMRFHGRPYYVGLLSAAALNGAAHQQAQQFQVMTDRAMRPVVVGRARLEFFFKKHTEATQVEAVKVETGSMRVSTPEATVFDLVRYPEAAGGFGHVVTVLAELAERIRGRRLLEVAKAESDLAAVQRGGLLLAAAGAGDKVNLLADWLWAQRPRTIVLRADRPVEGAERDARWRVLVNERVEVEE